MKIFIAIFVTILFLLHTVQAQDNGLNVERLITDYRGCSSNGKSILCYGDYGIITHTDDFGATWKQTNIGDKQHIKKILTKDNQYFGATGSSLINSTNNGYNWTVKQLDLEYDITDATLAGNDVYLLSKSGIYAINIIEQNNFKKVFDLDTNNRYSQVEADDVNLWIIYNDRYILHYDIISGKADTTDLFKIINLPKDLQANSKLSNMKIEGDNLYVGLNHGGTSSYKILQSNDKEKTWNIISPSIAKGGCYQIINNKVYVLRDTRFSLPNERSLLKTEYITIDSSHFSLDSTYETIINPNDSIEYRLLALSDIYDSQYKSILRINSDTMIGVGKNKLIAMTYNGGKNWKFISYYYYSSMSPSDIIYINKDTAYTLNMSSFYRTYNGGTTWLPQKYTIPYLKPYSTIRNYFFDDIGNGCVNYFSTPYSTPNVFISHDYGDTYSLRRDAYFQDDSNRISLNKNGIPVDDKILFFVKMYNQPKTFMAVYDKNYTLLDTLELKAQQILSTSILPDKSIICLGLNETGRNIADSNGNAPNYSYSYFLLRSSDKGKTWDSISLNIHQTLRYIEAFGAYYYFNTVLGFSFVEDDYLILPAYNVLYRYNYKNNKLDSLLFNAIPKMSFRLQGKTYIISYNNVFYSTANLHDKAPIWDSVKAEDLFDGWESYSSTTRVDNSSSIFAAWIIDDTTSMLAIGRFKQPVLIYPEFNMNIVKLTVKNTPSGIEHGLVEETPVWTWRNEPYPNPGHDIVRCNILWNPNYDIDNAVISVSDISGIILSNAVQTVKIVRQERYSGFVEWNCSNVAKGLYFITIVHHGETMNIPVIVR